MNKSDLSIEYKLIITIVKRGKASQVVAATKNANAKGGTILLGRGTASKNIYLQILGMEYEPEKEIILTLVREDMVGRMLQVIREEAQLDDIFLQLAVWGDISVGLRSGV
ncbi:MAG: P-II family nitrogen regulator [Bacteroidota bacterium]